MKAYPIDYFMKTGLRAVIHLLVAIMATEALSQDLNCLDVDYKVMAYTYAGSGAYDPTSFGGFYDAPNKPRKLVSLNLKGIRTGECYMQLVIDDTARFDHRLKALKGHTLLVINATDTVVTINGQDSRLPLVCQVYYQDQWQDIEYLPFSWCGNSYHQIFISGNRFWRFVMPCYQGDTKAKMRFRLELSNGTNLHSNEFTGSFNPGQLTKEERHITTNLMDPYEH